MEKVVLTLYVDPATAIREKRSRSGEIKIELDDADLAALSDAQREALAKHVDHAKFAGCAGGAPQWGHRLTEHAGPIGHADLQMVAWLLDWRNSVMAEYAESKKKEAADKRARLIADLRAAAENPRRQSVVIGVKRDGSIALDATHGYTVKRTVQLPVICGRFDQITEDDMDPTSRLVIASARSKVDEERKNLIHLHSLELYHEHALFLAQEEVDQKTYQDLYDRLPPKLRERHKSGFASESEILDAIEAMVTVDAGYDPDMEGWTDEMEITKLSDDEYDALVRVRKDAPAGAVVQPLEVWDVSWRIATDDDDPESIDRDGEVKYKKNVRRVIRITWKPCSKVEVNAAVTFESELECDACGRHGDRGDVMYTARDFGPAQR